LLPETPPIPVPPGSLRAMTARSFATAVSISILIAPGMYHHYLALLVLPMLLALGAGVPLRWVAVSYFLMWGGDQPLLGDLAWTINRVLPTAGALVLLAALVAPPPRTEPNPPPAPAPAPAWAPRSSPVRNAARPDRR
jgi:hypothetical protein